MERAPVQHTDRTTWYQLGAYCALWTIAATRATVFKIVVNGKKPSLERHFPNKDSILVSDHATALTFWARERRQSCWAHLLRKFILFSENAKTQAIGTELLDYVGIMFAYSDDAKRDVLPRAEFRERMKPIRVRVEAALAHMMLTEIAPFAGSCADILEHKLALWTFVDRDDVEPTNNHAERELGPSCFGGSDLLGTQSERRNLFAESLISVVNTARKQKPLRARPPHARAPRRPRSSRRRLCSL